MKTGRKQFGFYKDELAIIEIIKLKMRKRKGGKQPGPYVIARELNIEGYKSPSGAAWSGQTVSNIITRINNPEVKQVKKRSRKKVRLDSTDYMKIEEINLCREYLRPREKLFFEVMLGTGLRAFELCRLNINHIGIFRGKKQVDVKKGKGNKARSVDIGNKLAEMLEEYIVILKRTRRITEPLFYNRKGTRIKYKDIYNFVKRLGKRTGLNWLTPHKFRHTFATILYSQTHDLIYVMKQLGHSSVQITQIYADSIITDKDNPMEKFENNIF